MEFSLLRAASLPAATGLLCLTLVSCAPRGSVSRPASQEAKLLRAVQNRPAEESSRLELARYYLSSLRPNDALDVCREARKQFPKSEAVRDALSQALVATERFEEAVEVLDESASLGPDAELRKASAQLRNGDLDDAKATLSRVAARSELNPAQRQQAAQLQLDLANFDAAALLLSANTQAEAAGEGQALLGYALLAAGSYEAAVPVIERVAEATPNVAALQFYLGVSLRLSGNRQRLPEAEAALARAAAAEPQDALIQYELGLARVQLRQWELAREALEAAARLRPDLTEAQRDLSRIRERTGDARGAAIAQSRYLRLVGDAAAAVRLLEPLAKSGDLDVVLELCEAYYDNLQTPLTLANLKKLHDKHPKELRVLQARFRGERAADRNSEALKYLTQAQSLLPADDHSLDEDRIGLLRETGDYAGAEALMRTRIERSPSDAAAHYRLGAALARWPTGENRDKEAEPVLRKVLSLDEAHAQANYDLGMVLQRSGRAKEAIPHLRAALDRVPRMKDALRVLGQAYAATGDSERSGHAFNLYRKVEARESEQRRLELPSSLYKATPADRLKLASFYVRIANRSAAIIELETLLHKQPNNSQARKLLVGLYGQSRRFQRQFEERRLMKPGER